jgi:hypothetical protein
MITTHGANTHEEGIEEMSIENQKTFSDEQVPLAQKAQMKNHIKDEVAQKGIVCTWEAQREHRDFEENSMPKGFRSQKVHTFEFSKPSSTLPSGSKKISFTWKPRQC